MQKKTYGEEIIERLSNLDFTLPIDTMMRKIYSYLPRRMKKDEAVKYYTQKLETYWNENDSKTRTS